MNSTLEYLLKVGKVVANPIEIALLDSIVDSILKECDKEFEHVIAITKYSKISREEAEIIENKIIEHLNEEYDRRSQEKLQRTLPSLKDHYDEGGTDNLEIRKRILNRALKEKKGKLSEMICATEVTTSQQEQTAAGSRSFSAVTESTNIDSHLEPPPLPPKPKKKIDEPKLSEKESELVLSDSPGKMID